MQIIIELISGNLVLTGQGMFKIYSGSILKNLAFGYTDLELGWLSFAKQSFCQLCVLHIIQLTCNLCCSPPPKSGQH